MDGSGARRGATTRRPDRPSPPRRRKGRYRGAYWHPQAYRWMSQISRDGRVHHLGLFGDHKEAARANDAVARATYAVFAQTNGFA